MEQRRENDYKRRNCYSSLASHLLLSKHKKEQGGSFYALSVLYLPSSAWCEQTYSAVCTWNYSWLCSMLLFSRMILTTQPRHSIGRKTWLFTIQLCRWSFIPLSQEENRNFSVNKWSTLIGWYWDQSDLTQHIRGKERKRERKRERAKLGWAQSPGWKPSSGAWAFSKTVTVAALPGSTAWKALAGGAEHGAYRSMCSFYERSLVMHQVVASILLSLAPRPKTYCMHFPAWTCAKQSTSIPQVCMPTVLSHRIDGSPLPFTSLNLGTLPEPARGRARRLCS